VRGLEVPRSGIVITLHAFFGALVWGGLVSLLTVLPLPLVLVGAIVLALVYGLSESLNLSLREPGRDWQVPSAWVDGPHSGRVLVWSGILGPGFLTRTPCAGIWLCPLLAVLGSTGIGGASLIGAIAGGTHGTAVGFGVTNRRCCNLTEADYDDFLIHRPRRWRQADGLVLLLTLGVLLGGLK
jgi:hypothetical protein